jgi:septum formation protein
LADQNPPGRPRLVLASGSPRRREFLRLLGLSHETATAQIDESARPNEDPLQLVRRLSLEKARVVARRLSGETTGGAIVIGADTVVVYGDRVLGKPRDAGEARQMLRTLCGRTHLVHSGVTVVDTARSHEVTTAATSSVLMRPYLDEEIERYIASGDPFDKAGAYAIQHPQFHPVESIDGCYASVMGLPLCHLTAVLRALDVPLPLDPATICEQMTGHSCQLAPPEIVIRPTP